MASRIFDEDIIPSGGECLDNNQKKLSEKGSEGSKAIFQNHFELSS